MKNTGGDFLSADWPAWVVSWTFLLNLSLSASLGEAVSSLMWGHGWPQFTLTCFSGQNEAALYHSTSNRGSAIKSLKMCKCNSGSFIVLEASASTKATWLHLLELAPGHPRALPPMTPESCVEGTLSIKPDFNLSSSLRNDVTLASDYLGKTAELKVFRAACYTFIIEMWGSISYKQGTK